MNLSTRVCSFPRRAVFAGALLFSLGVALSPATRADPPAAPAATTPPNSPPPGLLPADIYQTTDYFIGPTPNPNVGSWSPYTRYASAPHSVAIFASGGLLLPGIVNDYLYYDVYRFLSNPDIDPNAASSAGFAPVNTVMARAHVNFTSRPSIYSALQFSPTLAAWAGDSSQPVPTDYALQVSSQVAVLSFSNLYEVNVQSYGLLVSNGGTLNITGVAGSMRSAGLASVSGMAGGGTRLSGSVSNSAFHNAGIAATGLGSSINFKETGQLILSTPVYVGNGGAMTFDGTGGTGGNFTAYLSNDITLEGQHYYAEVSAAFQNYQSYVLSPNANPAFHVSNGTARSRMSSKISSKTKVRCTQTLFFLVVLTPVSLPPKPRDGRRTGLEVLRPSLGLPPPRLAGKGL